MQVAHTYIPQHYNKINYRDNCNPFSHPKSKISLTKLGISQAKQNKKSFDEEVILKEQKPKNVNKR